MRISAKNMSSQKVPHRAYKECVTIKRKRCYLSWNVFNTRMQCHRFRGKCGGFDLAVMGNQVRFALRYSM